MDFEPDFSTLSESEWRRLTWHQLAEMKGRIGSLEKFKWLAVGGISVISVIVVPIFLKMVTG